MTTQLIEKIKKARIQAIKDHDDVKKNLLATLIGESEMKGKNDKNRVPVDADFISVMKKFISSIDDTFKIFTDKPVTNNEDLKKRTQKEAVMAQEKAILVELMPEMPAPLTDEQLRAEIQKLITELSLSGPKAMGGLMKELKARFDGRYDGGVASKIAKEVLV